MKPTNIKSSDLNKEEISKTPSVLRMLEVIQEKVGEDTEKVFFTVIEDYERTDNKLLNLNLIEYIYNLIK